MPTNRSPKAKQKSAPPDMHKVAAERHLNWERLIGEVFGEHAKETTQPKPGIF